MHAFRGKSRCLGGLTERFFGLTPEMAEHSIDRAVKSLKGGNDEHCAAAFRQDGAHVPKSLQIIADVFQHVQANYRVRPEVFQFQKAGIYHIHNKGLHMGMRSKICLMGCDTLLNDVDSDHMFPVRKVLSEIPHAATDLENPSSQMRQSDPALPVKIVTGQLHAFLIENGVFGSGGNGASNHRVREDVMKNTNSKELDLL
jgi:hypothetical protein